MLEESSMEKKNRSLQPLAKGTGTDSKKNPETQNGKQFPRGSRKREPSGNVISKNEPRRPPPQKSKVWDKRPKPRGLYYGGRKENTQITEELEEEFGSLCSGGNKKPNLNHLLNFHYEPRGTIPSPHIGERRNYSTKSLMTTHAHKYNKEQFLQANCQFVVRADGDYGCYLADPDLLVDWNLVELIRIGSTEAVICPICLYPPTAGKITRCGHIYCWMCILHYLALSDKSWRKCPICYESIHKNDLKSVECINRALFGVNQAITLQLMKREKGSMVVSPVNDFTARTTRPIPHLTEENLSTVYSKLLLAQRSDIDKIIDQEFTQLSNQLLEFKGCAELCFVEQAMESLQQRQKELDILEERNAQPTQNLTNCDKIDCKQTSAEYSCRANSTNYQEQFEYFENHSKLNTSTRSTTDDKEENNDLTLMRTSQSDSGNSDGNDITVEDLFIGNPSTIHPTKYFYFYQTTDGQHIYLHSINVKMLEKTYGTLQDCPLTIQGKIVEKEAGSMTLELRKRLKYLQHVPITCQFEVVELEFEPPLINVDVLNEFQEQIEIRKRRRLRQAKAEKRREKKIAEIERRQYGRAPPANLRIESHYHFPECGEVDFPRPSSPSEQLSIASSRSISPISNGRDKSPTTSAMAALSLDHSADEAGPSFAQMLREGKTLRPSGNTCKADNTVVWGQSRRQRQPSLSIENDPDILSFSPPARPSFNIAEALEHASRIEKDNVGRKKKKKQQKILFATGMPCPGSQLHT